MSKNSVKILKNTAANLMAVASIQNPRSVIAD